MSSPSPSAPAPPLASARKRKQTVAAAAIVGICGSLMLLASSSNESVLRNNRHSTIIPRLLSAVPSRQNPPTSIRALTTAYDDEPPLDLTSMYKDHEVLMSARRLASPAPPSSDVIPGGQYVVVFKAGYTTYDDRYQQVTALLNAVGAGQGAIVQVYDLALEGFSANLSSAQATALQNEANVDYVEPNYLVHSRSINDDDEDGSDAVPNEDLHGHDVSTSDSPRRQTNVDDESERERNLAIPLFNKIEPAAHWGLERLSSRGDKNGDYVYFHNGENTHLYLFDTAINENHDEFRPFNRFGTEAERKVCIGSPDDYLANVHGTYVASVAAGMTYGTARNATIHPIQVLLSSGKGSTLTVLCGVEWLMFNQLMYNRHENNTDSGPRKSIASITWGTNGRSDVLDAAVGNLAKKAGITTVVAAGNDGGNACNYSPYDPTAIMVASLDDSVNATHARSSFSNYGSCIDFFAPGADMVGASSEGTTGTYTASGTSVAAAIATGVGALYLDEVNTKSKKYQTDIVSIPAEIKERMDKRGYRNAVTDPGAGSPNVIVAGTANICKENSHCRPGDSCYWGFCM